jgi:hypothetical protein
MSLVSEDRPSRPAVGTPQQPEASKRKLAYMHDAAHYSASLIAELRLIAGNAGLDKLVKALDAAYYEAYAVMEPPHGVSAQREGEKPSQP